MYLAIGQNCWAKHEYAIDEVFLKWLKYANYPTRGGMGLYEFECEMEECTIDDMGMVSAPKDSKKKEIKIDLETVAPMIEKLQSLHDDVIEKEIDLTEKLGLLEL